ncbi:protease complex subunit PrcB family protein [Ammoniphilus resinae]|uniref:Copper amine oxidase-like N-terminal domain-containing protein n=1 Tax=Ammoniphilus resinae TaxID=861532 RepID=A0ABS4GPK7_9BACL|nr:protease complex subunit PrcB family protein [Ammoniphilus resinae]MBP1932208.1 hypothetical protein [Ammoniphilus resinae]
MFKKSLVVGTLLGSLGMAGIGSAVTNWTSIDVRVDQINFSYNGEQLNTGMRPYEFDNGREYVPLSFNYKGTTYVPLRYVGHAVGKEIKWDAATNTVHIQDRADQAKALDYTVLAHTNAPVDAVLEDLKNMPEQNLPKEIKEWFFANRTKETQQVKTASGKTYILLSRGESPNPGHGISLESVTEDDKEIVVSALFTEPGPDELVAQVISHPAMLIQLDGETDKKVRFEIATPDETQTPPVAKALGTRYVSSIGYILDFPAHIAKKLKAVTDKNRTEFQYLSENPEYHNQALFSIVVLDEAEWVDGTTLKKITVKNGKVFAYTTPLDMILEGAERKEFEEMSRVVPEIIKTFTLK